MDFPDTYQHSVHSREERRDDGYTREEVEQAVQEGTVLETYKDTGRGEAALLLHWINEPKRPVHVVVAPKGRVTVIITVYDPSKKSWKWNADYTERIDHD